MRQDEPESAPGDWPNRLWAIVAAQVRRYRKDRGMSAQQLADRCADLGLPISRSALSTLENGRSPDRRRQQTSHPEVRRPAVTLDELLVLATALDVPPIMLMLPIGRAKAVEVVPGRRLPTVWAAAWLTGDHSRLAGGDRQVPPLSLDWIAAVHPLTRLQRHEEAVSRAVAAFGRSPAGIDPARARAQRQEALDWLADLNQVRWEMVTAGEALPDLPPGLPDWFPAVTEGSTRDDARTVLWASTGADETETDADDEGAVDG